MNDIADRIKKIQTFGNLNALQRKIIKRILIYIHKKLMFPVTDFSKGKNVHVNLVDNI